MASLWRYLPALITAIAFLAFVFTIAVRDPPMVAPVDQGWMKR